MHPAIRIVFFLVALGVLAHARWLTTLTMFIAALVIFPRDSSQAIPAALRLLWRLKWLLLSVLVLYLVITPGPPLLPAVHWSPSSDGIGIAMQRVFAWGTIMYLYVLFSLRTSAVVWQAGLYWLLRPLTQLGFSIERLMLRMALTLQAVEELRQQWSGSQQQRPRGTWRDSVNRLGGLVLAARTHAESVALTPLSIETIPAPRWYEWSYPLLLLIALVALNQLAR